jgi:hypothetical protein
MAGRRSSAEREIEQTSGARTPPVIYLALPSLAVKKDQGDSDEDDRPPICPACGVTMGIREDRTSTRFVCLECGFSDEAGSGS